ncbi:MULTISPECIES: DUF7018 domain-containing (lipo)protein [Bacillus]|uniref:DUF7018 domain-containing (lipo)protein n=1 Tax=Bacillus TaxID=1386 RepID=UPI0001A14C6A|nr:MULTISPECIES: hypothetical protein [Bacillus]AIK40589.1 hypothetical protein DJ92_677 [Bacillus pseudomycoides]AJI17166.1 hypothetical protein BG07_4257 [Bacillus pseudomycoides]EEM01586.1 hypothetical protein bmyco0002_61260 [Bacillus pseudomycoides]EEM16060.1 hypothetical protein bpmyx0001_31450 [Bacillus pseudomycoides DSM 12442]MCX2828028.1 hypothetical protein [Bacillus sp. DHT2]
MKRKLLAVALPIMLVAGVGCSKDASESKTDSLEVAETDNQEVSNSKAEKEYKSKLNSLMKDITKESLVLKEVITSDKSIKEKEEEYREKSKALLEITDKVIELDPGKKYNDVQNTVKDAMYELKGGISSTKNGLIMKDKGVVQQGADSFTKASDLLLEADKKMKNIK